MTSDHSKCQFFFDICIIQELVKCAVSGPHTVCVYAEILQLCLTLFDPMDSNSPGSSLYGIPQARILDGLPCPPLGDLSEPGIEPGLLHLLNWQVCYLPPGKSWPHLSPTKSESILEPDFQ